jgi:hypothetical protein
MKGMRKFLFMVALVALVGTLATTASLAQAPGDPWLANRTRTGDDGTVVFPRGTATSPGSQLLYLVDFGARTATDANRPVNYLTVTNVHSTQAVTVHVRYLSSVNCTDILDYLVVLTPNDVWQFDPFNIEIPRPDGTTTGLKARDQILSSRFANVYGDGRFLIFIAASGAFHPSGLATHPLGALQPQFPTTGSPVNIPVPATTISAGATGSTQNPGFFQRVNIAFPNSVYTADLDAGGSVPLTGFLGVDNGLGGQRTPNYVLNVLTAKHISFNYLIGSQTLATAPLTDGSRRSFGLEAWARPAVVFDHSTTTTATVVPSGAGGTSIVTYNVGYDRDGDGPPAEFRVLLSGGELVPDVIADSTADGDSTTTAINDNYLRSEIQNGFYSPYLVSSVSSGSTGSTIATRLGWRVRGGAIAWDRIFPTDEAEVTGANPDRQVLNMISIEDDYNGSKNTANRADDRASGVWSAHTLLATQVYNNAEIPLVQVVPDVLVSPPVAVVPANRIAVVCINVFLSDDSFTLGTNFGDASLRDLYNLASNVNTFVAQPVLDQPQGTPGPPVYNTDLAGGWMRFNRLRQELADTTAFNSETANKTTDVSADICGAFACGPNFNPRTFSALNNAVAPTGGNLLVRTGQHSYVWLGRYNIQFRELGAAYWMHHVSDEDTGIGNPAP